MENPANLLTRIADKSGALGAIISWVAACFSAIASRRRHWFELSCAWGGILVYSVAGLCRDRTDRKCFGLVSPQAMAPQCPWHDRPGHRHSCVSCLSRALLGFGFSLCWPRSHGCGVDMGSGVTGKPALWPGNLRTIHQSRLTRRPLTKQFD